MNVFGFQSSVTPLMEGIIDLHNHIFFFLVLIFVFVFWGLVSILYRFWWKLGTVSNRFPLVSLRHFSHNTLLEVIWTILPSFILVSIAVPSFALLYAMDEVLDPTLTLKVVGHQWYWSYQYSNCISQLNYSPLDQPDLMPAVLWERLWANAAYAYNWLLLEPSSRGPFGWYLLDTLEWGGKGNEMVMPFPNLVGWAANRYLYRPVQTAGPDDLGWFYDLWVRQLLTAKVLEGLAQPVDLRGRADDLPSVHFDSYMLDETELPFGSYRLLEVDEPVVLPANTHIRLLITADDVLHSFAVPQLGIKVDAIPGRLNQQGLFIKRLGSFYGQCSELCGVNHGFMPIVVRSVSTKEFVHWYLSKLSTQQPQLGLALADGVEVRQFLFEGRVPSRLEANFPVEKLPVALPLGSYPQWVGSSQLLDYERQFFAKLLDRHYPDAAQVSWTQALLYGAPYYLKPSDLELSPLLKTSVQPNPRFPWKQGSAYNAIQFTQPIARFLGE